LLTALCAMAASVLSIKKPTGPSPRWIPDLRIAYVPGAKKVGTISGDRYQLYCGAQTVGEALKLGCKRSDLAWDWERGILQVVGPIPEAAERRGTATHPTKSQQLAATPQKQAPEEQKQAAPREEKSRPQKPQKQQHPQKEEKVQQPPLQPVPEPKRVRSLALPQLVQWAKLMEARQAGSKEKDELQEPPAKCARTEEPSREDADMAGEAEDEPLAKRARTEQPGCEMMEVDANKVADQDILVLPSMGSFHGGVHLFGGMRVPRRVRA